MAADLDRRSLFAHAAVALAGGAVMTFIVPGTEARAIAAGVEPIKPAPDDPLLALIEECRRQMAIFNASGNLTSEEDAALAGVTYGVSFEQLCDAPPAPTTMRGALEALRLAHEEMEHTMGSMERPLVGVALAFL